MGGRRDRRAGVEIRGYSPDLRQSLIELQRHLWGANLAVNHAYFAWKYEQNPYMPQPVAHLAFRGGELIGMRGACGTAWQVGASPETIVLPYPDDLVIVPHARSTGVLTQLLEGAARDLEDRGYDYMLNLSASKVTAFASLRQGWRRVGWMRPVVRRHSHALGRSSLRGWGATKLGGAPRVRSTVRRMGATRLMWSRREVHPFAQLDRKVASAESRGSPVRLSTRTEAAAMASLVATLGGDRRLRHLRDVAFFNWRYANPVHEYRFLLWGNDPIDGYLVLQCHRAWRQFSGRVTVVDWEASSDEVLGGLLACAVEQGGFVQLACPTATLSSHRTATLAALGFVAQEAPDGFEKSLLIQATDSREPEDWKLGGLPLLDLASWHLRGIYSMDG